MFCHQIIHPQNSLLSELFRRIVEKTLIMGTGFKHGVRICVICGFEFLISAKRNQINLPALRAHHIQNFTLCNCTFWTKLIFCSNVCLNSMIGEFRVQYRLMHTYIIHTTSLALCQCTMFRRQRGHIQGTRLINFHKHTKKIFIYSIDLAVKIYQPCSLKIAL